MAQKIEEAAAPVFWYPIRMQSATRYSTRIACNQVSKDIAVLDKLNERAIMAVKKNDTRELASTIDAMKDKFMESWSRIMAAIESRKRQ